MSMTVTPVTLEGKVARLEPLSPEQAQAIYQAAQSPTIWSYLSVNLSTSLVVVQDWINAALQAQEKGTEVPFVIIERASNSIVGATRYLNIMSHDRGLEIGWTWLNPSVQRTPINTECKYLLLRHAFEALGAIRVQFKTDSRNLVSQRAIERLGAVKEGVLRNHMIMPDGYYRHSVYYSIIAGEWPQVKAALEAKLSLIV